LAGCCPSAPGLGTTGIRLDRTFGRVSTAVGRRADLLWACLDRLVLTHSCPSQRLRLAAEISGRPACGDEGTSAAEVRPCSTETAPHSGCPGGNQTRPSTMIIQGMSAEKESPDGSRNPALAYRSANPDHHPDPAVLALALVQLRSSPQATRARWGSRRRADRSRVSTNAGKPQNRQRPSTYGARCGPSGWRPEAALQPGRRIAPTARACFQAAKAGGSGLEGLAGGRHWVSDRDIKLPILADWSR
jgi:hypothetical protein